MPVKLVAGLLPHFCHVDRGVALVRHQTYFSSTKCQQFVDHMSGPVQVSVERKQIIWCQQNVNTNLFHLVCGFKLLVLFSEWNSSLSDQWQIDVDFQINSSSDWCQVSVWNFLDLFWIGWINVSCHPSLTKAFSKNIQFLLSVYVLLGWPS